MLWRKDRRRAQGVTPSADSVDEDPKVPAGRTHKNKNLFFWCLTVHLSRHQFRLTVPSPQDLCQGHPSRCFDRVALIFQLNSGAHHECQTLQLQLPWAVQQKKAEYIPICHDVWHHRFMNTSRGWLLMNLITKLGSFVTPPQAKVHSSWVSEEQNLGDISKMKLSSVFYLAAVGICSQPCTLKGCEASPPWCPRAPWCVRRRSGRLIPGSGWPAPAQRGWL